MDDPMGIPSGSKMLYVLVIRLVPFASHNIYCRFRKKTKHFQDWYSLEKTPNYESMKRGASGGPEGAPQRSEKAAKEGGAEPEFARGDPLVVFLHDLSAEDANEWHAVLLERRVRSFDDLVGLARDKEAWDAFHAALAQQEPVLASKLNAWRQGLGLREPSAGDSPGKLWRKRSFSLCFLVYSFAALPRLASSSPLV